MEFVRTLTLTLAVTASATALAQNGTTGWQSVVESPREGTRPLTMALVVNEDGDSIRIYRDDNDIVRGIFALGDQAYEFEDGSCPTVRVDQLFPHPLVNLGGPCELENPHVYFTLGVVNDGHLESTMLWQLMNGGGIRVWYQVEDQGYRESRFSLRRSLNALVGTLGAQVEVVP